MMTPALNAWHDELRNGMRTVHVFDALWQAACYEMNAREMFPESNLRRAQQIIRATLNQRGGR